MHVHTAMWVTYDSVCIVITVFLGKNMQVNTARVEVEMESPSSPKKNNESMMFLYL